MNIWPKRIGLWGVLIVASVALGCGGKSSGGDNDGGGNGTDGGGVDGGNTGGDAGPQADAAVCAQSSAEATLESKPIDIILVIDNSGSMGAEITEVEKQINANFANILDNAVPAIDYRVILVSHFGSNPNESVCISAPLGGIADADVDGHCDTIPSAPVNTAKFFHHSIEIGSHNGLCRLLEQFDTADEHGLQSTGYQEALRPDAFKFIVVVTDDGVNCSTGGTTYNDGNSTAGGTTAATDWDAALLALSPTHFGASTSERNYSFWSIIAVEPNNPTGPKPYGDPAPPSVASTTGECTPSAVDPGTGYQSLSILTDGYRYPTCGLDYTDMFQLMAQGVIQGASVACEFAIPDPPMGETLDLSTVQVKYTSGAVVDTMNQANDLASCSASANEFYIEDNLIKLCPNACTVVQSDENAEIDILFGCDLDIKID